MAAFALGLRDTLEAAIIIALALAALIRLGRGNLAQAVWIGVGAGALFGFSIGTGLAAAEVAATGSAWTVLEIVMMTLAVAALAGLVLTARRFATESGPAAWLAVGVGLFAALPQVLDVLTRLANNAGGAAAFALTGLGVAVAAGLAALLALGLIRARVAPARKIIVEQPAQPVSGELTAVHQRAD
jgi:high-affinity iron transporter